MAASDATFHVGEFGPNVYVEYTVKDEDDVVLDLSSATTKRALFRKHDGTDVAFTAAFVSNGTDGKLKYAFQSGDLDQAGRWQTMAHVVTAAGDVHYSTCVEFIVKENFEP